MGTVIKGTSPAPTLGIVRRKRRKLGRWQIVGYFSRIIHHAPTVIRPAPGPGAISRDELLRAFDASWDRNEAAYRYLGR